MVVTRFIMYLLDIIEILLGIRFILRFLGAGPSEFSNVVFALSQPLVEPFQGLFRPGVAQGAVIEWSTLTAMAAYAIAAYILLRLLHILIAHRPAEHTHETHHTLS